MTRKETMTREEAIEWLKTDISRLWNTPMNNLHKEALNKAIKALENQCPSKGVDCEDCPANELKSEWEQDHAILKAYSDGANDVLDKIRAEINRQEKWLLQAGYTAYNVDIAFDTIKAVLAESEVRNG